MAPPLGSDEVFIDGLPVGTFFAFMFNALSRVPKHCAGSHMQH